MKNSGEENKHKKNKRLPLSTATTTYLGQCYHFPFILYHIALKVKHIFLFLQSVSCLLYLPSVLPYLPFLSSLYIIAAFFLWGGYRVKIGYICLIVSIAFHARCGFYSTIMRFPRARTRAHARTRVLNLTIDSQLGQNNTKC